ncbi:MAG: hypothetical protein UW37_C0024G0007 [Candidatus Gottesmanbacteria bacterium GW2011_GWA2_44_17]|uniref:Uncharacterized protein n=2 Tax=Candidatus Gottesmaniibacteriota TaxID=1752720 RepID=A0A0G1JR74_9BACT|nr:MAG: hypothetical protein UW37_C0024G0007 [Candidatus Gottesmanbacteria bacterium GW2011_GWA2_44_17]
MPNTTTDVFNVIGDSITTGEVLDINSTSTGLTTGGSLLRVDWQPASATTSTADLVVINISSDGNAANLLNITDAGSSLFSVSETAMTSNIPANFTAAGDVSIAYDLVFTNQTSGNILSYGPLTIESGESFENNDLTLKTYGTGSIILDAGSAAEVQIGAGGAGSATPDYFALDVKSTTGDPGTGAEGYMYYNTYDNAFRCYTTSAWAACGGASSLTRTVKMSPEFDGATFTASASSSTIGTMTADTINDATEGWLNYYEWTSTEASLQDYHLVVKVTIPSDFSSWATSNAIQVLYETDDNVNTNNKFDLTIFNEDDTPNVPVYQTLANLSTNDDTWYTLTIDDSGVDDASGNEWDAADETALFLFKLYSMTSATPCGSDGCYVRIGDIKLTYTASN